MDREGFRNRMKQYKKAREENPGLKYYDFMERLAEFKAKEWNDDPDMVLQHMLNDNSYNYQQMYEDNPNFDIQEGHFVDTYKTAYHPTFSEESMYSGKKSPYNPEGIIGGSWDESTKSFYLNDKRQSKRKAQDYLNHADPGYRAIPKYDGGGEVGKSDLSWWEKLKAGASTILMNLSHQLALGGDFTNLFSPTNVAQDSYLVDRNVLQKMFESQGYTKVDKDDYGLVRKAVGNRNIPIFQRKKDSKKREDLTVLENLPNIWYGAQDAELDHAGSYPSAVYVDKNGYLYQKAWDLNDYGEHSAGTGGFTYGSKQWFANTLDKIGSPTVVTTGFQPIINDKHEKLPVNAFNIKKKKFKHTGEVYEDAPDGLLSLLDYSFLKKGLRRIDLGDSYTYGLPEVEVRPKKYKDGGEVIGPPTYELWYAEMNQYNPIILDDASLYWSIEAAKKDLHKQAMGLPGYAPMWHQYVRSLPKADPDINQFVDDLWANENPNNAGYRNGKYYPHKSPEGGKMTIGPGFKLDSGSHGISTKTANRGMTKTRLDQEARKIGKQHLKAVDQFINYGQTTNPADTVSPQIKMGLMDLRHLVGPLNEWGNLRQAVLEGDLDRIRKESTVTWNDNGKTKVDKRRKKIRDEKYFHYAEGGQVEPDPLDVLEASRPKFHGIPLAKGNIDGVFSPIDIPLATLPKVWPVVNKWLPNYGQMLGTLVGGDNGLTVNRKAKPLTTKQIDADVKEHYEDVVIPLRPLEDYIKQIYLQNPNNFIYNVYADNALPDNRLADFNNATGEVRIKESILNSPISSQILAHEINGHRSDRLLPRSKEAKTTIDKAFKVRKKPLSKESKLLAEKEAETTRLSYNFYKHMKDNGLLLVKKPMTKTKAYQDYVLNATDDQIDAMLGNSTVYSRDYKASGIDYDKIRWALAYAPEIAAGLIIPQHLLNNNKESKQWI